MGHLQNFIYVCLLNLFKRLVFQSRSADFILGESRSTFAAGTWREDSSPPICGGAMARILERWLARKDALRERVPNSVDGTMVTGLVMSNNQYPMVNDG